MFSGNSMEFKAIKLFNAFFNKMNDNDTKRMMVRSFSSSPSSSTGIIPSIIILLSIIPIITTTALLSSNLAIAQKTTTIESSTIAKGNVIPPAQSIYDSQSMILPTSVGSFVWYIVNEAHEDTNKESQKIISTHNPNYLPTNIAIPQGVAISFLNADAPWDTPHPHTINIKEDNSGKTVYTTGKMDYSKTSKPTVLPAGKYNVIDTKYPWMKGSITVMDQKSNSSSSTNNLVVGGFLTPTNQVANNKDNDGGVHPGWLGYYKTEFLKNGFTILSEYNFHYAACKYCPGGFWPDQKTADHTLIIYSTNQPLPDALLKLEKMVKDNVYI